MMKGSTLTNYLLIVAAIVGFGLYQRTVVVPEVRAARKALKSTREDLARIEQSVALLHFRDDPKGKPVEAILAHLDFWAKKLAKYGNSLVERPTIDANIRRGMDALLAIGPRAFPILRKAFFDKSNENNEKIELRRQILFAMRDLAPEKTKELATQLLLDMSRASTIRVVCAELLLELDKDHAGDVLRRVILRETHIGPRQALNPNLGGHIVHGFPGYSNLISYFLQSNYPAKDDVLLNVLGRGPAIDVPTLITVTQGLRMLHSKAALEPLKQAFHGSAMAYRDPMFRRHCINAIAEIGGSKACSWLREQYAKETDPNLERVFQQVLAANCRGSFAPAKGQVVPDSRK